MTMRKSYKRSSASDVEWIHHLADVVPLFLIDNPLKFSSSDSQKIKESWIQFDNDRKQTIIALPSVVNHDHSYSESIETVVRKIKSDHCYTSLFEPENSSPEIHRSPLEIEAKTGSALSKSQSKAPEKKSAKSRKVAKTKTTRKKKDLLKPFETVYLPPENEAKPPNAASRLEINPMQELQPEEIFSDNNCIVHFIPFPTVEKYLFENLNLDKADNAPPPQSCKQSSVCEPRTEIDEILSEMKSDDDIARSPISKVEDPLNISDDYSEIDICEPDLTHIKKEMDDNDFQILSTQGFDDRTLTETSPIFT